MQFPTALQRSERSRHSGSFNMISKPYRGDGLMHDIFPKLRLITMQQGYKYETKYYVTIAIYKIKSSFDTKIQEIRI